MALLLCRRYCRHRHMSEAAHPQQSLPARLFIIRHAVTAMADREFDTFTRGRPQVRS